MRSCVSILRVLLPLIGAWVAFQAFIHFSNSIESRPDRSCLAMLAGTADKPYVTRALLPATLRLALRLTPAPLRDRLRAALAGCAFLREEFHQLHWNFGRVLELTLASLLLYGCLAGFALAVGWLCDGVLGGPDWFGLLVQMTALGVLPALFNYQNYVYDPPTLFLFTLALGCMARRRWTGFMMVYLLACLNKETTILLTLIFALHFRSPDLMPRPRFRRLLTGQLVIYGLVKLGLAFTFRHNPGAMVEFHLDHNIELLTRQPELPTLVAWLVLALLVFYRWAQKPLFLRHGLAIMAPLLGLTLFLGFLDELRDYYEAYPIILLLIAHSGRRMVGMAEDQLS